MSKNLTVPKLNPNDPVVELALWYFKTGDKIESGDALCDFATTKAAFTFDSTESGFLKQKAKPSSRLQVGDVFAEICATKEESLKPDTEVKKSTQNEAGTTFTKRAKEKIQQLGLKESDFAGHAYVTEKMVLNRDQVGSSPAISILKEKEIEALQMGATALRSSLTIQIPAQKLLDLQNKSSISVSAVLAWASAQTLRGNPRLMDQFSKPASGNQVDIGYAIDTGSGTRSLLASDCAQWTAAQWQEQITDWGLRLLRNKIEVHELGSGKVTLTDLTSEGLMSFEPLLVGMQSSILGFAGDMTSKEPQVSVTMAFDHRVHNGRQVAQFLKALKVKVLAAEA